MADEVTIAVHNGTDVAVAHNLRDPEVCSHEPHIDPNGIHETWHHADLRDFYNRTFGAAQREYDNKARACRRIGDYLDSITRDAVAAEEANVEIRARNKQHKEAGEKLEKLKVAKKPVYEIIAGIYPQGDLELTEQESRDALHLWVFGDGTDEHPSWEERNPGLKLVGVYYHADEPDARPHVHIDYVPVAECSRGMRIQNSLEGALNAQGKVSGKVACADGIERLKTAQEQFTDAERDGLQKICEEMGFEVLHPQRGKKTKHKSTAEKKRETQAENLDAAREHVLAELQTKVDEANEQLQQRSDALDERSQDLDDRETALDERSQDLDARKTALDGRSQDLNDRETALDKRSQDLDAREISLDKRSQDLEDLKRQLNGIKLNLSSKEQSLADRETKLQAREDALDEVERAAVVARQEVEKSSAYLMKWRTGLEAHLKEGYGKQVADGTYSGLQF